MNSPTALILVLSLTLTSGLASAADCNQESITPTPACLIPEGGNTFTVVYRLSTSNTCTMTRGPTTSNWAFPIYLRSYSLETGAASDRKYQLVKADVSGQDYTLTAAPSPSSFVCVKLIAPNANNQISARLFKDFAGPGANVDVTYPVASAGSESCSTLTYPGSSQTYDQYAQANFGASMASLCANTGGALPVHLVRFTASARNSQVELRWETASEENFSHFAIERSTDGQSFSAIAQVASLGSNSGSSYSHVDVAAPVGIVYYRLRMIDRDGSSQLSSVARIQTFGAGVQRLYPNTVVAGGTATLALQSDRNEQVLLQLISASGELLSSRTVPVNAGSSTLMVEIPRSAKPGAHYLRVISGAGEKTVHPLIVQ